MSRLTDLIARAKAKDPALGDELDREFKALASRRAFGLNFERHKPESVELPGREVRRGDKVHVLPPRGTTAKGDQRLWRVLRLEGSGKARVAHLSLIDAAEPDNAEVPVADLVVVAEFRDYIYPGLVSTGKVTQGGDKPFHTVINGENFHALEALTYTHRGKIDAIYIDPPYNTGARDWKYNNDYVEAEDLYRHSKWLAFMERRLKVAGQLMNPSGSVLIVTIDEKEYLRLGILLEQTFPEATIQMCTTVINPSGTSREYLSRVEEFVFFVFIGGIRPARVKDNLLTEAAEGNFSLGWESLLRRGNTWYRSLRPNLCYPVLIDAGTKKIVEVGQPFTGDNEAERPRNINGMIAAWPVRTDGRLGIWRVEGASLMALAGQGYATAVKPDEKRGTWSIKYLMSGTTKAISSGKIQVERMFDDGPVVALGGTGNGSVIKTIWNRASHNAGMHGSALLRNFIPDRKFPFPKSLYAVEDALRAILGEKDNAIILDFFSGSGTTAHAVMRLNRQDGGRRQCISVTNNEVAADEQAALRKAGLRAGDPEWEKWGICDYITKPRIAAAISGKTPDGQPIAGDYKFTDEFPMAEGFEENAEFFTLTYEAPVAVSHNLAFQRVAPLLWMRAGSEGRRIDDLPAQGWEVADTYGLLVDLDRATEFCAAAVAAEGLRVAYVVTDDDRRFQAVTRALPDTIEPVRLYESYLSNFRFAMGR